jgi:nicotinate-nucleotide adenylyltransferase
MIMAKEPKHRIALFGGSFDPVHIGHLFVADEVRVSLGYDRVIFIPAARPPHKSHEPTATAGDRVAMLSRAINQDGFAVDNCEIDRGGVSYTIDTVRYLIDTERLEEKPGLIIGDDLVDAFERWKEPEALLDLVDLIVVRRDGVPLPEFLAQARTIDISPLPVSSSMVRRRIRQHQAFRYLVAEGVFAYIEEHRLYRTDDHT